MRTSLVVGSIRRGGVLTDSAEFTRCMYMWRLGMTMRAPKDAIRRGEAAGSGGTLYVLSSEDIDPTLASRDELRLESREDAFLMQEATAYGERIEGIVRMRCRSVNAEAPGTPPGGGGTSGASSKSVKP